MVTKAERSRLHQLDQQIKSLVAKILRLRGKGDNQLLAVDWEIEIATTKTSKIFMNHDNSDDQY